MKLLGSNLARQEHLDMELEFIVRKVSSVERKEFSVVVFVLDYFAFFAIGSISMTLNNNVF